MTQRYSGQDADEHKLEITITDPSVSAVKLATWIREGYNCSVHEAIDISRSIIRGETWSPSYGDFNFNRSSPYCYIKRIEPNNPYTTHFNEQAEYRTLLKNGANGDAEAAIAWCKLEREGKISHGAFA